VDDGDRLRDPGRLRPHLHRDRLPAEWDEGISWDLDSFAGTGAAAPWVLGAIGIIMTVVMQSSTAAAATTLVALDAGSLNFEQGCALVVGQSVGTAATSALATVSRCDVRPSHTSFSA
jgi:hypothetical protein